MSNIQIDFNEVQKAMEDTVRDSFDYFLDRETGEIVILSEDIIRKAHSILYDNLDEDMADFDGVEFDEEIDMEGWMEDEVELALDIFLYEEDRYVRIPERRSADAYSCMKEFAEGVEDRRLRGALLSVLEGKGAFSKFKKTLESYPKERKQWHRFNARRSKKEIESWLSSLGIGGLSGQP